MLTVGEILKKERERKGYFLAEIEKEIKVRKKFLQAVENNDWRQFSSRIYIVGIIKNYSRFLGLDSDKVIVYFYRDYEKKEEIKFKRKLPSHYLNPETKKIFFIVLGLIFTLFFIYFGYQLKVYFSPPKVTIISPKTNIVKKDDSIKIIGRTEKEAVITVLGERIYQNKDGVFEFNYPVKPGKNIVTIDVVGANGKKTVISREFVRQKIKN